MTDASVPRCSSDIPDLRPCPFCGEQPVTERTGFSGRALYVYCINDNGCPRPKAIGETVEKAAENWNLRYLDVAQRPTNSSELFCDWLRGYFAGLAGKDELTAREANQIRNTLNSLVPSPVPSTNSGGAATKHSGTFLGYRDEHGNEMHCAHAFCPHQAKCRQGCINPVAVTSTHEKSHG